LSLVAPLEEDHLHETPVLVGLIAPDAPPNAPPLSVVVPAVRETSSGFDPFAPRKTSALNDGVHTHTLGGGRRFGPAVYGMLLNRFLNIHLAAAWD